MDLKCLFSLLVLFQPTTASVFILIPMICRFQTKQQTKCQRLAAPGPALKCGGPKGEHPPQASAELGVDSSQEGQNTDEAAGGMDDDLKGRTHGLPDNPVQRTASTSEISQMPGTRSLGTAGVHGHIQQAR